MKVAVVHDYVTQRGGAERVALALLKTFPGSRLVTSVYRPDSTFPEFADHQIETMWPNSVPFFRSDPRRALPVLARAFSRYPLSEVDLVLCSSSGWAHGVTTPAPKIVYCHNPARWLYQPEDYLKALPGATLPVWRRATEPLRRWDRRAALSADLYVTNSNVVAQRVERAYGIASRVIAPPIAIDPDGEQQPVLGLRPGYLLTVGRRRSYKNTDIVGEAVAGLPDERLVVVGGLPERSSPWPDNIIGLEALPDAQLRWVYANAAAVVAMSFEDFGLTPVEGYAFGKPAIVLRYGGYLDTMIEGCTGEFVEELNPESLRQSIRTWRASHYDEGFIRGHAQWYSIDSFSDQIRSAVRHAVEQHRTDGRTEPKTGLFMA